MKVLMLNGSPRKNGNTAIALEEMKKVFEAEGVHAPICLLPPANTGIPFMEEKQERRTGMKKESRTCLDTFYQIKGSNLYAIKYCTDSTGGNGNRMDL